MMNCITTPGCQRPAKRCGACGGCYQRCLRDIKAGLTTRKRLEAEGKLLPPQKPKPFRAVPRGG